MNVLIHPNTKQRLDALAKQLPQSALLSGELGVGLLTIARELAGRELVLVLEPKDIKNHPDHQNGTISVEMIRELYDQTRTKHAKRQIIIIDDADRMSLGAQGAFLKLLEEPGPRVHFILTSHSPDKLLPTIRSRVQQTQITPITPEQTEKLLQNTTITDPIKRAQLSFIAEGLPAEIIRLAQDEEYFNQRAKIMSDARHMLQSGSYDQLLLVQEYQSDRGTALQLIDGMLLIARRSLSIKSQVPIIKQIDRLLDIQANIQANYNIRLQLARIML
ncbi:MAG TPA: AAA family ATPase [Candidatus Saccharimonadales bacterium]|nr:AAA family ATPase [Candidatus Saccharimonadales bacterium]